MLVAAAAVPVALKVPVTLDALVTVAVTTWVVPAVVPSVQFVDALPSAPVVTLASATCPPPWVTANPTATLAIALPNWSFTWTSSAAASS
jgi:hypothetical protein